MKDSYYKLLILINIEEHLLPLFFSDDNNNKVTNKEEDPLHGYDYEEKS
jgi:hypothetical protein